jgi:hypothetical protein
LNEALNNTIQALVTRAYQEKAEREKYLISLQECKAKLKEKHDTIEASNDVIQALET